MGNCCAQPNGKVDHPRNAPELNGAKQNGEINKIGQNGDIFEVDLEQQIKKILAKKQEALENSENRVPAERQSSIKSQHSNLDIEPINGFNHNLNENNEEAKEVNESKSSENEKMIKSEMNAESPKLKEEASEESSHSEHCKSKESQRQKPSQFREKVNGELSPKSPKQLNYKSPANLKNEPEELKKESKVDCGSESSDTEPEDETKKVSKGFARKGGKRDLGSEKKLDKAHERTINEPEIEKVEEDSLSNSDSEHSVTYYMKKICQNEAPPIDVAQCLTDLNIENSERNKMASSGEKKKAENKEERKDENKVLDSESNRRIGKRKKKHKSKRKEKSSDKRKAHKSKDPSSQNHISKHKQMDNNMNHREHHKDIQFDSMNSDRNRDMVNANEEPARLDDLKLVLQDSGESRFSDYKDEEYSSGSKYDDVALDLDNPLTVSPFIKNSSLKNIAKWERQGGGLGLATKEKQFAQIKLFESDLSSSKDA